MTAQALGSARRRSRNKAARRRLPRDLLVIILILAALYAAARFALRPEAPPTPPSTYQAPAPIPVLPAPPALGAPQPAPTPQARRAPQHVLPETPETTTHADPWEGLERLDAKELDRISQAR